MVDKITKLFLEVDFAGDLEDAQIVINRFITDIDVLFCQSVGDVAVLYHKYYKEVEILKELKQIRKAGIDATGKILPSYIDRLIEKYMEGK